MDRRVLRAERSSPPPHGADHELTIAVLGGFRLVTEDGRAVLRAGSERLLAFLAVTGVGRMFVVVPAQRTSAAGSEPQPAPGLVQITGADGLEEPEFVNGDCVSG